MREKRRFLQAANDALSREVAALEAELGSSRDDLSKLRQRRDRLRAQVRGAGRPTVCSGV